MTARPQQRSGAFGSYDGRGLLGPGLAAFYLGLIVLIPIAALLWQSFGQGLEGFLAAVTSPQALAALQLEQGLTAEQEALTLELLRLRAD